MGIDNAIQRGDRIALDNFGAVNLGTVTNVTPTEHPGFMSIDITWDDGFEEDEPTGWAWPSDDLKRVR